MHGLYGTEGPVTVKYHCDALNSSKSLSFLYILVHMNMAPFRTVAQIRATKYHLDGAAVTFKHKENLFE
jgi:hypothetical protein